ncbi:hypothetical protein [Streptomyces capoamus]
MPPKSGHPAEPRLTRPDLAVGILDADGRFGWITTVYVPDSRANDL